MSRPADIRSRSLTAILLRGLGMMAGVLAAFVLPSLPAAGQSTAAQEAAVRHHLEVLVTRSPERADAWLQLAGLELRAGDAEAAETILTAGLDRNPKSVELRRTLVGVRAERSDWPGVESLLAGWPGPLPPDMARISASVQYNRGLDALQADDLASARGHLALARERAPDLLEPWRDGAQLELSRGRLDEARRILDAAELHHPNAPELKLVRARTVDPREGLPLAADALRTLRARRPGDLQVALDLSTVLAAAGELSESMALQDTLLAGPRPAVPVFQHAAEFWLNAGVADSAAVRLERGVAVHPQAPGLHALLGSARSRLARAGGGATAHRRAAASFLEAAARSEESAWSRVRAAREYLRADDTLEARAALESFATVLGPRTASLEAMSLAREAGADTLARRILDRAAIAWPDDAEVRERDALWGVPDRNPAWNARLLEELAAEGYPTAALAWLDTESGRRAGSEITRRVLRAGIRGGLARSGRSSPGESVPSSRGRSAGTVSAGMLLGGGDLEAAWTRRRQRDEAESVERLLQEALGQEDWADEELGRLVTMYPERIPLRLIQARRLLALGAWREAVESARDIIQQAPTHAPAHLLQGRALEAGEQAGVADSYLRALELDSGCAEAFDALVRISRERGELPALQERLAQLRRLTPTDTLRIQQEIEVLHRLGRSGDARGLAELLARIRADLSSAGAGS